MPCQHMLLKILSLPDHNLSKTLKNNPLELVFKLVFKLEFETCFQTWTYSPFVSCQYIDIS